MDNVQSNRRTDDELEAILVETADWVVNGRQGRVLGFAGSLRRAMERAADYAASGAVVTALGRLPFDNVVVLPKQIDRLRKLNVEREIMPIMETEAWTTNVPTPALRPLGAELGTGTPDATQNAAN
jgi:hypothetical protein